MEPQGELGNTQVFLRELCHGRGKEGSQGTCKAFRDLGGPTMDVGVPRTELKGLQNTREGLRGQGGSERLPEML